MGWRLAVVVTLCACGARLGPAENANHDGLDASATGGSDGSSSVMPDAPLGPWGTATPVTGASTTGVSQDDCTMNSTETELYFKKATTAGDTDLYLLTRATPSDPWSGPTDVTTLNSSSDEESPRLSNDDLTIYFGRAGTIYSATRGTVTSPWNPPAPVTQINTGTYNKWLAVCEYNNVPYFMVSRAVSRGMTSDQDLFIGPFDGTSAGTDSSLSVAGYNEISAFLSRDCLTAAFASNRSGSTQIYMATRSSPTDDFTAAMGPVTDFGTANDNEDLWISGDQHTAVFASVRDGDGSKAVYESTR